MPLATLISTHPDKTHLQGVEAYAILDPDMRKMLWQTRKILLKELNANVNTAENAYADKRTHNQATILIEWDPTKFQNNFPALQKTLHTDANAEAAPLAALWRHNTKHRTISSEVTCYATGAGIPITPMQLFVTTGCAFNFSGGSQEDMKAHVLSDGSLKDPIQFQKDMVQLFKRWLKSQDNMGVEVVLVPMIGGGFYLKSLSKEGQKKAAACIVSALIEATYSLKAKNIKEVVLAIPDLRIDEVSEQYLIASDLTKAISTDSNMIFTLGNVDIITAAHFVQQKKLRPGTINPGSDRTIGGYFQRTGRNEQDNIDARLTLEELLCNVTDLAYIHSVDYNPNLSVRAFSKTYDEATVKLTAAGTKDVIKLLVDAGADAEIARKLVNCFDKNCLQLASYHAFDHIVADGARALLTIVYLLPSLEYFDPQSNSSSLFIINAVTILLGSISFEVMRMARNKLSSNDAAFIDHHALYDWVYDALHNDSPVLLVLDKIHRCNLKLESAASNKLLMRTLSTLSATALGTLWGSVGRPYDLAAPVVAFVATGFWRRGVEYFCHSSPNTEEIITSVRAPNGDRSV